MAAIFQADIWCDDCAESIKDEFYNGRGKHERKLTREEWEEREGLDDERNYDSGEYPKYCADNEESDCPEHCAGCHVFLENDLTADGEDYVRDAVAEDRRNGNTDSVACTVWAPFYDYLDFEGDDGTFIVGERVHFDGSDDEGVITDIHGDFVEIECNGQTVERRFDEVYPLSDF